MKRLIRLFRNILKDERGIDPIALAAGGGLVAKTIGGIVGAFGKDKKTTIDPFAKERGETSQFLTGRLGQRTSFTQDPALTQAQPGIEAQAEKAIGTRLGAPITAEGITADITKRAFDAQRARQKELFEEEREATQNRFNRLGLVSSTPGLQAQSDLSEKQRISGELLASDLAVQQIQSQLQALGLQETFAQANIGQALGLGQTQRAGQAQGQAFSLQDLQRQIAEEQGASGQAVSFLTGQPAETFFEPSFTQRLGQGVSGVGQSAVDTALLSQLLGFGKKKEGG